MKKSILELGKVLAKTEQKEIKGSGGLSVNRCSSDCDCFLTFPSNLSYGYICNSDNICVRGIYFQIPCS
ncbi:hypothetical protein [uncultured Tenacibaculum sp.]|uniref:hypothetical protein n=1 Tax=uncultured Tenacibaculum sp. TaxID=174713 RepID=UPI00262F2791|nr:hypothetical protein [uncultured Tenacibaculum sp.]